MSSVTSGDELNAAIGARTRELREEAEWSLTELSERAGLSRASLSRLETNKEQWTSDKVMAVANAFGVDYLEILVVDPQQRSLLAAFRREGVAGLLGWGSRVLLSSE